MSVINNNVLAGAAGSGGAAGYTIDNSLRLNSADSAYIQAPTMTSGKDTYTISLWSKRTRVNYYDAIFSTGGGGTAAGMFYDYSITPGAFYSYFNLRGGNTTYTIEAHSDCSAWYHIVVSVNSGAATIYVNGVEQIIDTVSSTGPTATFGTLTDTLYFGVYASALQYPMDGYLADIHFIDGQAKAETDFGEFDDNGVWQPIKYAGTYGSEGFHLDFSDNSSVSALGNDSSGNGNHCTVNNISVTCGNGSYVSNTTGTPYSTGAAINAFDDDDATYMLSNAANSFYGVTFSPGLTGTLRLYASRSTLTDGRLKVNGTEYTSSLPTGAGSPSWVTISYPEASITSIEVDRYAFLRKVEVDGVVLVDNAAPTTAGCDSLFDSPTDGDPALDTGLGGELPGNYCTWNGIGSHNKSNNLLSNGNLDANHLSSGWDGTFIGTFGVSSGKWYWETTWTGGNNADIGVTEDPNYSLAYLGYGDGVGLKHNGYIYQNTAFGSASVAAGVTLSINDVVGVALDLDNGKMWYSVNGTWVNSGDPVAGTGNLSSNLVGTFYPAFTHLNGTGTAQCTANFGQRPFAYQAPSGFKCLCTANLPTPTIVDSSTGMDVVLYDGNSTTNVITGLDFSPDLFWEKVYTNNSGWAVIDSVRGRSKVLDPRATDGELTSSADRDLVSFDSNGFTLGDSQSELTNWNSESHVAWVWDAGTGSASSNTDGGITSQVKADQDKGFSIVTYTGTGSVSSVGHGLGQQPGMIIVKSRTFTNNSDASGWFVYHNAIPTPERAKLSLHLSDAAWTGNTYPWNATVNSSVFGVNNSTSYGLSNSGIPYVAYCWAPVDGYSAFGSYTGTGNADGPFNYTGFKPKWIMIKAYNFAMDWVFIDTERNTYNAANSILRTNLPNGQATSTNYNVDILSNGFKLRSSTSPINSGYNFVWAAFADLPFKYARAS